MGKLVVAAGVATAFFALSSMAKPTEAGPVVPLEEKRATLLENFNRLATPSLDDRLITINRILDTYPPAPAQAEDFDGLVESPDKNESIRGLLCLTAGEFNNNPEILTHDGLGLRGDKDIPAMSVRLGLANTLFGTANRVCGYPEPLVPFVIEQKNDSRLKGAVPPKRLHKDTAPPRPEKHEPAPVRGFVMMA
jgi:hypothetical protein